MDEKIPPAMDAMFRRMYFHFACPAVPGAT
jgi:hypothetical protein